MIKNLLIVEDEAVSARRLVRQVKSLGYGAVEVCHSGKELEKYLERHSEPDLYLMDIHLSDCNIFGFLNDANLKSPIIFTTAYDQYALNAFKQNSIDYLLKPIQESELKTAIKKYEQNLFTFNAIDSHLIQSLISQKESFRSRIPVQIGESYRVLDIMDITHFSSENKSTFVHHKSGRNYILEESLSEITNSLDPRAFFQVSRSHTINIAHIVKIHKYSGNRLFVEMNHNGNFKIIVSRERVKHFKDWLSDKL